MVHAGFQGSDLHPLGGQQGDEGPIGPIHGVGRELPLGRRGLVGRHRQNVARSLEREHPVHRAREHAQMVGMERDRDGPSLLVTHHVDDRAVAIQDRDPRHFTLSHFVAAR
jgi:hypothetical protein